jgi:tight adherence protein B
VRKRLGIALAGALVAFAAVTAAGTAASPLRLTEAGTAPFPQRTYILMLPAGQRLQASGVKVSENGRGVIGLTVKPVGEAGGVRSGTVLAIDASNSMKGAPITSAVAAARAFAARRNVNQSLAILTFNSSTHVARSFTTSQAAIDQALAQQPRLGYKTHLYDSVTQAVALLRTAGIGAGSVIVLSDGADIGSAADLQQTIDTAKTSHVRVFTVGLRSKTFRPGPLQQLAIATGGTFSRADSPADLQRIYDELGLQLAQEYVVTYNSVIKPGRPVHVVVAVGGVGRTTAGYVSPTLTGPSPVFHSSPADRVWRSPWLMVLVALLIPALLATAVIVPLRQRHSTVKARVSDYVTMPQQRDPLVSRVFTGTERSLERTRWWQRFKDALLFADVTIPPVQVVVGTLVLTLFAVWAFSRIGTVLGLVGLATPLVVRAVIMARVARKRRAFGDQLPDNLDVLASGLRAGHSLVGALSVVVSDAAEPSRTEFQRVIADEQLGIPLEAALDGVAKRMKNRDIQQVALVAAVQSETGGNAAEVLDRVTESIRERQELRRLVRTLTAQGRLARMVVSFLPLGLLLAISILNPEYLKPLFTHTSGRILLVLASLMVITGSWVIGKIVDIKV